jgi:hypothetical protein
MKKLIPFLILIFYLAALDACSKLAPTEEQVFQTIKTDSIISKDDSLELKSVSLLSSTQVDQNYSVLLKIDFIKTHEPIRWKNKDLKDFIPSNMQLAKGLNSVKVTATLSMSITGDRSWYIENFSF